jgi:hypothetical protein
MASNATPEGIATNGTDVWIVDSKSDKVFKYAGAATRLSGSQNAASSFNLNSSNTSPKDVVTNGLSLWVVNDSSTDKVFKYSVGGSLQGSWTTTGAGSQPTGITIDPTNVSDIWIVDAGSDRVYQFTAAVGRTSGSQSAAASFALAAGNTNPQGIADPPRSAHATRDRREIPTAGDRIASLQVVAREPAKIATIGNKRSKLVAREQALESFGAFRSVRRAEPAPADWTADRENRDPSSKDGSVNHENGNPVLEFDEAFAELG